MVNIGELKRILYIYKAGEGVKLIFGGVGSRRASE